ncbi:YhcN/YlaJ family sporulation lipoprotein [Virgibacillus ainsalahensis]
MKWKLFSVLTVFILMLAACGTDGDNQEGQGDNPNVEPTRYNNNTGERINDDRDYNMRRSSERAQDRDDNNNDNNNGQSRYEVAEEAADRITEKIDEIDNAYVLTTDNNAYVAAGLDNDNEGNRDQENRENGNITNNTNNNANNNGNNTGNRDHGEELTEEVKEEISNLVKEVDNDIDNVYISTNPDFVDLTNNYVDDVDNGRPVEGFFQQFGNMVERLFPQNR